ncbi:putative ACR, YggU family [Candidatus Burarchaeum australiense]|nr:putative ACR, YggU family [Candidatus Burarchaeum australiense]
MLIEVTVKPNSRKFAVKLESGKLAVSLTEPAEKNKANLELVKGLARLLGCEVKLIGGLKSKRKRLELGLDERELRENLGLLPG